MTVLLNISLLAAVAGALTFIVLYQLLADWRSTSVGQMVMALMLALIVFLSVGFIRTFGLATEHIDYIRLGAYTSVAVIVWRLTYLLVRAQRRRDR